jgi:hypothetical protein
LGVLVILPWLYVTALLGQSDLGLLGVVVAATGLVGLAIAVVAAVVKPSWRLLWLALPLLVTHGYMQVVGGWLIGDHHEIVAVSLFALALVASVGWAAYAARANPVAVLGATMFALAYAWVAYQASLFVFWNGLH